MQTHRRDGIGRFSFHVLREWISQNSQIQFYLLLSRKEDALLLQGANVYPVILSPTPRHPILNFIWLEFSVRNFLNRINPDLYIGLDGMLVSGWKGKQLSVIHDINFYHSTKYVKFSDRIFYQYFFPRYAKQAVRVATVSNFSKMDIAKRCGVDLDIIDVVYNGIAMPNTVVSDEKITHTRTFYTQGHPYFYFVGSLSPRKNILRMLEAFDQFSAAQDQVYFLVISGASLYRTGEMHAAHSKMCFRNRVVFTGSVSDETMQALMTAAHALLFVPVFEGFGIPVIEAMQCEVPVIASNVTSVPEVSGDAALLVDPYNVSEIVQAMQDITQNPSLRAELIEKGKMHVKKFSWEKTADLLWHSVEKAIIAPQNDP